MGYKLDDYIKNMKNGEEINATMTNIFMDMVDKQYRVSSLNAKLQDASTIKECIDVYKEIDLLFAAVRGDIGRLISYLIEVDEGSVDNSNG